MPAKGKKESPKKGKESVAEISKRFQGGEIDKIAKAFNTLAKSLHLTKGMSVDDAIRQARETITAEHELHKRTKKAVTKMFETESNKIRLGIRTAGVHANAKKVPTLEAAVRARENEIENVARDLEEAEQALRMIQTLKEEAEARARQNAPQTPDVTGRISNRIIPEAPEAPGLDMVGRAILRRAAAQAALEVLEGITRINLEHARTYNQVNVAEPTINRIVEPTINYNQATVGQLPDILTDPYTVIRSHTTPNYPYDARQRNPIEIPARVRDPRTLNYARTYNQVNVADPIINRRPEPNYNQAAIGQLIGEQTIEENIVDTVLNQLTEVVMQAPEMNRVEEPAFNPFETMYAGPNLLSDAFSDIPGPAPHMPEVGAGEPIAPAAIIPGTAGNVALAGGTVTPAAVPGPATGTAIVTTPVTGAATGTEIVTGTPAMLQEGEGILRAGQQAVPATAIITRRRFTADNAQQLIDDISDVLFLPVALVSAIIIPIVSVLGQLETMNYRRRGGDTLIITGAAYTFWTIYNSINSFNSTSMSFNFPDASALTSIGLLLGSGAFLYGVDYLVLAGLIPSGIIGVTAVIKAISRLGYSPNIEVYRTSAEMDYILDQVAKIQDVRPYILELYRFSTEDLGLNVTIIDRPNIIKAIEYKPSNLTIKDVTIEEEIKAYHIIRPEYTRGIQTNNVNTHVHMPPTQGTNEEDKVTIPPPKGSGSTTKIASPINGALADTPKARPPPPHPPLPNPPISSGYVMPPTVSRTIPQKTAIRQPQSYEYDFRANSQQPQLDAYRRAQADKYTNKQYDNPSAFGTNIRTTLDTAQTTQIKDATKKGGFMDMNDLKNRTDINDAAKEIRRLEELAELRRLAMEELKRGMKEKILFDQGKKYSFKHNIPTRDLAIAAFTRFMDYLKTKNKTTGREASEMFIALHYRKYKEIIDAQKIGPTVSIAQFTRPVINKSQYF